MTDGTGGTLVAGVGNIFLGDDGFGVETVRRLAERPAPPGTEYLDVGIRGVHLAYRLLDGYRRLVVVDALARGAEPGTVVVLDATEEVAGRGGALGPGGGVAVDAHSLDPAAVLRLIRDLHRGMGTAAPAGVHVVGCEPLDTAEGIGLSAPVAAAVPYAMAAVDRLTAPVPVTRSDLSEESSEEGTRSWHGHG
ncbi:hydrogenase maturation protease [Streptomyces sp. NPDC047097]|uniref:hydrogenase maturation protease n=1 Tax=Streptomyces sp. NPDC047097 TaxID=3155260 RepID=UPI0033D2E4E4